MSHFLDELAYASVPDLICTGLGWLGIIVMVGTVGVWAWNGAPL